MTNNKFNMVKKYIYFIIIFIFLIINLKLYYKNYQLKKESIYYYRMSYYIKILDYKSTKFYAKKILSISNKNIYYDISCFILFNLSKNKKKKHKKYKNIINKNEKSIFKKLIL